VAVAAVATLGGSAGLNAASAVQPAANATGINIQVPRAHVSIVGTLSSGSPGTPASNAAVWAIDSHGHQAGYAITDSSGLYRLADLPHDDYRLAAGPGEGGDRTLQSGFYRAAATGHFTASRTDATVLHYSGTRLSGKDVTLPIGFTVSGRITRAATGAGVSNAFVSAEALGPAAMFTLGSVTTDSTGHYVLPGLSQRSYTVHVSGFLATVNVQSGCYRPSGATHFIADCGAAPAIAVDGNVAGINMALPTGLTVSGSIVDRASSTPLCAYVSVVTPGTTTEVWSDTACGSFAIGHLSPGSYQVLVRPDFGASFENGAYTSKNANLWVPEGAAPTTISLASSLNLGIIRPLVGHVVSGHVRDGAGHPLSSVGVVISGTDGWCCDSMTTGADGTFSFGGLANRRYVIRFTPYGNFQTGWYGATSAGGFAVQRVHATEFMLPADRSGVDVRLPAGYSISGRITDPDGHGLYSYLGSFGPGAPTGGHGTAANGTYTIPGFAPGGYKIQVVPASSSGIPLRAGWYSATAPGHFTLHKRDATPVHVGP
jgi:hypothetical protein